MMRWFHSIHSIRFPPTRVYTANQIRPRAIIVDSIQRMYLEDVTGTAGSVSQIKECAAALNYICKLPAYRAPVFLIGHVVRLPSLPYHELLSSRFSP